ncbi:hypothetical protein AJ88_06105 [Mesorhizobium amorphae CCBAU 01583]|nr:hypothetical protein AJ88_06105 [Mesorhizobium amorphae CCBAU 01583]
MAPSESPEPALDFVARVAGVYQTKSHKLLAEQIGVRSGGSSEVMGTASVTFVDGKAPGISVSLNVHDMPFRMSSNCGPGSPPATPASGC